MSLGAQKALYIAADMATDSDPDKVVDFALKKLGGLDYLVLNHIGPSHVRIWDGDVEHTRGLMKVMEHLDGLSVHQIKGIPSSFYICARVFACQRSISSATFRWLGELCRSWSKVKDLWWLFHHFWVGMAVYILTVVDAKVLSPTKTKPIVFLQTAATNSSNIYTAIIIHHITMLQF